MIYIILIILIVSLAVYWTIKSENKLHDKTSEYRKQADGKPFCPICGSTDLSTNNRGFSIITGTIGSKDVYVTCIKCGHRWKAGQYNYLYKD